MSENKKVKKKELFFLFLLIILFVVSSFKFSFMQFSNYENKLMQIVNAIKVGKVPYKDFFDNTPPLNFYFYLTAFKIFDYQPDYINLRIFILLYIIFFVLLLYIVSRMIAGPAAAMLSSLLYFIFMYKNIYSGFYYLEGLLAQFPIFLSLMFLLFIEKGYEKVDYFLSGFFLCVASYAVFSLKFIFFIPVIYIVLLWKKENYKIKYIIWFASGFIFMELLAFLWAIVHSVLKGFVHSYFIYNFASFFNKNNLIKIPEVIFSCKYYYILLVFVFFYFLYKSFLKKKYDYNLILFLFSTGIFIMALFQKNMNTGYFYLLIPFISIMTSVLLKDFFIMLIKK